jgi:hypothetical protein
MGFAHFGLPEAIMSDKKMRAVTLLAVLGMGLLASGPAYACHERTGWCCTEVGTNYFCCYWENNVMREGSCKWQ